MVHQLADAGRGEDRAVRSLDALGGLWTFALPAGRSPAAVLPATVFSPTVDRFRAGPAARRGAGVPGGVFGRAHRSHGVAGRRFRLFHPARGNGTG